MGKRAKEQSENAASGASRESLSDAQVRELLSTFRRDIPFASAEAFSTLQAAYSPLLRAEVDSFRQKSALAEVDREDLLQEASIVLLRAARRYDLDQSKVTFGLYLKICLRNALISQLRHVRSRKEADAKLRAESVAALPHPVSGQAKGRAILPDALSFDPAFARSDSTGDRAAESSMRRLAKLFAPPVEKAASRSESAESAPADQPTDAPTATAPQMRFPRTPSLEMLRKELLPLLTRYEREVFRRFYAGVSYADIAAELSRSVKSVDNALFRIRKKWRAHFWTNTSDSAPSVGQKQNAGSDEPDDPPAQN